MRKHSRSGSLLLLAAVASAALASSARADNSAAPTELTIARVLPPPTAQTVARSVEPSRRQAAAAGCHHHIPRARRDRPDMQKDSQVHIVYLVPADAPDQTYDTRGILDCSMRTQNEWFEEVSGGMRWSFDTFTTKMKDPKTGRMRREVVADVTFVRSAKPGELLSSSFDVADELEQQGFAEPNKRYLSFVAAESGACGDANFPILAPGSVPDGKYAQVYLLAPEECRSSSFGFPGKGSFADMIAQQELIHNDGVVGAGAPHGCPAGVPPGMGHVCTGALVLTEGDLNLDPERIDVMYPYVSVPLSKKVLDPGNEDYFQHPIPTLPDLADSPYLEPAR